jgi:hypothetical protein
MTCFGDLVHLFLDTLHFKYEVWLWSSRNYFTKLTCMLTACWEGSPSKYFPWAAMHLAQWCCHCWKLFWNSCCWIAFSSFVTFFFFFFFGCLRYPEIFVPLRQTLFVETSRSHSEPYQGNVVSVTFQWTIFFFVRNCLKECALLAETLLWWRIQTLGVS